MDKSNRGSSNGLYHTSISKMKHPLDLLFYFSIKKEGKN